MLLALACWGVIAVGVLGWVRELLGLLVSGSPEELELLLNVGCE